MRNTVRCSSCTVDELQTSVQVVCKSTDREVVAVFLLHMAACEDLQEEKQGSMVFIMYVCIYVKGPL